MPPAPLSSYAAAAPSSHGAASKGLGGGAIELGGESDGFSFSTSLQPSKQDQKALIEAAVEKERERVEELTIACVSAQKERAALHQILDSKVSAVPRWYINNNYTVWPSLFSDRLILHLLLTFQVRKMVSGLIGEVSTEVTSSPNGSLSSDGLRSLLVKMKAMEQVLVKVGDAIRLAPPILPPEEGEE